MASSSSSSVVFARARAAFDLLSAGDLGFVGALSWKLLLSCFLDVSFLNVCATDLNGEFSSRSPCATTARVARDAARDVLMARFPREWERRFKSKRSADGRQRGRLPAATELNREDYE